MRSLVGEVPLEPEVSLAASLGVVRNDWDEERAVADLTPDLLVPGIAAAQLTLVEPYLDARGAQARGDTRRGVRVVRGVAEEDGTWAAARGRAAFLPRFVGQVVVSGFRFSEAAE